MKKKIAPETVLTRRSDLLYNDINGEVVMLSIRNGEYYSLNSVGSCIWDLLQEPCTFQNLVNTLLDTYEVSPEKGINDTLPLLYELLNKGLIEISDE